MPVTLVDPTSTTSWARRLVVLLFIGLLVALPAAWITSQYMGNEVNSVLSYAAGDGWCEAGVYPGMGKHCFGDYASAGLVAQHDFGLGGYNFAKGPYNADPLSAYNSLYPPVSQFPHVATDVLRLGGVSPRFTFDIYIGLLILAVLVPAIWVAWVWRGSAFAVAPLLIIGVAALPAIAAVDRGNSAGFVVPLLLLFAVFLGREPPWAAPAAAAAAALVRPQFILITVALLAIGRWRQALAAVGAFVFVTFASFAVVPGGFVPAMRAWVDNVTSFRGGFGDVRLPTPANISFARTFASIGQWLQHGPGIIHDFGGHLTGWAYYTPLQCGVAVLAVALLVLIPLRRHVPRSVALVVAFVIAAMLPGVVPAYYLAFALVIAACVLADHLLDGAPWFWGWPLLVATVLSIAPIPLARDTAPGSPLSRNSILLEEVGKVWLAVVVVALAWVIVRAWRSRHEIADGLE
ncbi:MAG: glycosyltransferase 87 family protein [Thermoleophilia bacterium]